ncbi:hypothetical protein GE21DRAFT_9557 [Neurospora crassa]|uniref:Uncharacterized protein n=1 Tax=Neurospora crassa (strain ATCC 24698 / 74-OR23-1A / CBS 708.71 / DSM 1257 / FGSC 987) TaxID=367110 RepID=Q7RXD6_NEUCR|nr:hypothetical protein NCU05048 [Neurospora crassa OR74A]EAA27186.1 hypothetical protein NCU05048 [Neurospora crassa OR74A]KHE83832.1 hypothetical protein GE21DRAFT_9557 [Neurospora crassa]|eukprot:XP_956422.1 hypothetical protein NCU05048 [Neurospora crassa OR74A]
MRSPFGTTGLARSLGLVALVLSTTCAGMYIPSARVPLPASNKDVTTITVTTISTAGASVTNLEADSSISVPTAAITPISRRTRSRRPVTVVETVTATTVMETVTVTPAASSSATNSIEDSSISTEVVTDVVVVSPETVTIIYGGGVSSTDAGAGPRGAVSSASDVSSSSADAASTSIGVTTVTVFPEVVPTSTVGVSSSTDEVSDSTSNNAVFTLRTTITLARETITATEVATPVETSTSVERTITIDTAALITLPTSFVTLTRRADNKAAPSSSSSSAVWNPLFGHGPVVVSTRTATLDAPKTLSTVFVKAKRTGDAAVSSSGSSSSAAASASTPAVVETLPGIVVVSTLDAPATLSTVFVTAKRTGDAAVSSSGSSSSAAASASSSADAAPISSTTSDRPLLTITKTSTSVTATVIVTVAPTRTSTSVTPTVHVTVVTATVHVAPAAPTETRSTLQLAQDNCLVCQDIFDDNGIVPPEKVPASAAYAWKRSLDLLEEPLNDTAPGRRIQEANDDVAPFLIPPMLPTGGVPPVSDHADAAVTGGGAVVTRQLIPPMMPGFSVATHITRSSFSPISLAPVTNNADSYTTRSTNSPIRLAPITNNADHATRPTQTATPIRLAPINNITTPTGVHQPQPTDFLLQPKPFMNHAPLKDVPPGVVDNDHLEPLSQKGTAKSRRSEHESLPETVPLHLLLPPFNLTNLNQAYNQAYNPIPKSTI